MEVAAAPGVVAAEAAVAAEAGIAAEAWWFRHCVAAVAAEARKCWQRLSRRSSCSSWINYQKGNIRTRRTNTERDLLAEAVLSLKRDFLAE